MLVSIDTYEICNGTLAGGVAISELRLRADRIYDFIVPVDDFDSTLLNRICTRSDLTFLVKRTHVNQQIAENFILQLDTALPTSGLITLTTTGPTPVTRLIYGGRLLDHALIQEQGATTFHQYHIAGGPPVAP